MRYIITLTCLMPCFLTPQPTSAEVFDAIVKPVEVKLHFISKKRAYSCKHIEEKLIKIFKHLGVSEIDINAQCPGNVVRTRLRVNTKFSTLQTAPAGSANTVRAIWKEITIGTNVPTQLEDGDCELTERFIDQILPTIEHQVIAGKTGCDATDQRLIGKLRIKVLQSATK